MAKRRDVIRTVSGAALVGLTAGCTGGEETPTETGTATETELATEVPGETGTPTESPTGTEGPPTEREAPKETPAGTETETENEAGTETPIGDIQLERRPGQLPEGLQLSDVQYQSTGENGGRVTGTIENTGDQSYEELEVQVTLLDDTDDILGKFFDNTEESEVETPFESGETWDFAIEFESADLGNAAAYRIDVDGEIDQNVDIGFGTETPTSG